MKVLFLTSTLGNGHTRAADAVERALKQRDSTCQCRHLDLWSLMDERVAAALKDGYLRMTREHPNYYQKLYDLDAGIWRQLAGEVTLDQRIARFFREQQRTWFPELRCRMAGIGNNLDQTLLNSLVLHLCLRPGRPSGTIILRSLLLLMRRVLLNRLREEIKTLQPDVVAATQMYPAALYSQLKANGEFRSIPSLGIATDYGAQKVWAHHQSDYYCVGDEPLRQQLHAWGVPLSRIQATGIPLMPEFQQVPSQSHARLALQLPTRKKIVLVIGGQYGIGIADAVAAMVRRDNDYHIVVIACDALQDGARLSLLAEKYRDRITLFDWVDDMSQPLSAADIVVGKPGGLSVSEALACGRPFLATCSLGGQERHNTQYISKNNVGRTIQPAQLSQTLNRFFQSDQQCRALQRKAYDLGHRHGAEKIAALIEEQYLSRGAHQGYPVSR